MACSCNVFNEIASGGMIAGGDATVVRNGIGGVIIMGGSAIVDSNDPWDGMSGVWLLDEDSTGDADDYKDKTEHQNHGTGGDGTLFYCPVQVGGRNCLDAQFFEDDDWIKMDGDSLLPSQAFSFSCWIMIDGFFRERLFFSRGIESPDGDDWVFAIGHTVIHHLWARLQMADNTIHYCFSTTTMDRDKWYHVACTFDPESGLKTYLNGELNGTNTAAIGDTATLTTSNQIGKWNEGGFFDGIVQDVRLHPVERSAEWFLAERDNYCDGGFYIQGETVSPSLA